MGRISVWFLLGLTFLAVTALHDASANAEVVPSESECRPYIERALNELKVADVQDASTSDEEGPPEGDTSTQDDTDDTEEDNKSIEDAVADPASTEDANDEQPSGDQDADDDDNSVEDQNTSGEKPEEDGSAEADDENKSGEDLTPENDTNEQSAEKNVAVSSEDDDDTKEIEDDGVQSGEDTEEVAEGAGSAEKSDDNDANSEEDTTEADAEDGDDDESDETVNAEVQDSADQQNAADDDSTEQKTEQSEETQSDETDNKSEEDTTENATKEDETAQSEEDDTKEDDGVDSKEGDTADSKADDDDEAKSTESTKEDDGDTEENDTNEENDTKEQDTEEIVAADDEDIASDEKSVEEDATTRSRRSVDDAEPSEEEGESAEKADDTESDEQDASEEPKTEDASDEPTAEDTKEDDSNEKTTEDSKEGDTEEQSVEAADGDANKDEDESAEAPTEDGDSKEEAKNETEEDSTETVPEKAESEESHPEDDLLLEFEIPANLRNRQHIAELLYLDDESENREVAIDKVADVVLKDLKRIYENAIKPLESLYKYRDLSNRHFGDPEIFSKPLVLFMGPWSGGKSTLINYLTGNEYTMHSLRTGAEPSPAYFNILMHGDEPEVLDGTQLAADWTFSGLQKFGQGLEDRLRGLKLPNKLLEKVNIVEIPGILEVRKQVSRLFPFNDACQWFIDRADIIFLVYDPSKLDVGPETEAILDQLKGREYQTRIILNKADQVKPEELLRVQGALIWNISPLMSSAQPPVMYTTSLWSHPYEVGSPARLLQAQERALLRDLRTAVDKRIENKIASARRFAVRVRNHAKMVDCYLTTYFNHKTLFGNKKQTADQITQNPQNYHIYEGLSTLTNISRYDLPDPDVYRDFFRLNPLFEFKKLSETCTYFRGCPINKLDISIAYDLPELVGKYKKLAETALTVLDKNEAENSKGKS